jgi:hypothetical protein
VRFEVCKSFCSYTSMERFAEIEQREYEHWLLDIVLTVTSVFLPWKYDSRGTEPTMAASADDTNFMTLG